MLKNFAGWRYINPVTRATIYTQVSAYFIELSPFRSESTKSTLAAITSFIVHRSNPVAPTILKSNKPDIFV